MKPIPYPKASGAARRSGKTGRKRSRPCIEPTVTAIIPAYNMGSFIERTLASALGQTYPGLRILVIDDGSTDRSREIAERFSAGDDRVRVETVTNRGVAMARNHGLRLADTHYVAFLDADDLWHPTKIEKQVAALAGHGHDSDWAGAYALTRFIDPEDRVLGNDFCAEARGDFLVSHLYRNHIANGSNLMVRRDAALSVGGFSPDYARLGMGGIEDYDFQLKLLDRYKIELVREFLVGYRVYQGQMSDDPARMGRGRDAVIKAALERSNLLASERRRVWTHAKIVGAIKQARSGHIGAMAAMLLESVVRQPVITWNLLCEIIKARRRRLIAARESEPRASVKGALSLFSELEPGTGVTATDEINTRPNLRMEELRARSSAPLQGGEVQNDRTASA